MNELDVKPGFTTHMVPLKAMVAVTPVEKPPQIGDLIQSSR
jgi:hypothetical protein